ncbi:MAG TPA: hypothetical protein VF503_23005 [Sphingobium sp.]|uniref:hypothetical protein n=1 Tax=Sphingobium sp. TaxID=1912891 RepID=UPI002ED0D9D3
MPQAIRPVRVNHINMVLEDFDSGIAHFRSLYGADVIADYPQKEWHAGLFEIGRVIFEPFVPPTWLLSSRYGAHYLGIEYQAEMEAVRAAVADHGVRIVRDIGLALHTHPADTFGVAFEFYDGSFHDRDWPLIGGQMKSADYWRDAHPLGLTGLKAVTIVAEDGEGATRFLQSFLSAEPAYEEARPDIAAHAIGLTVADAVIELLVPTGVGAIRRHLDRWGPGIRSTVLGVRDIGQAQLYFADQGVELALGDRPGGIAVPAEANRGVIFEFAE